MKNNYNYQLYKIQINKITFIRKFHNTFIKQTNLLFIKNLVNKIHKILLNKLANSGISIPDIE